MFARLTGIALGAGLAYFVTAIVAPNSWIIEALQR